MILPKIREVWGKVGEIEPTPEMAVKQENIFGLPARFWNNLEKIYRDRLALQ